MKTAFPYWTKQDRPLFKDLDWNIPEQKTGRVAVVGGNSQSFATVVRISEFLKANFPVKTVETVMPDALRGRFPAGVPDLTFLPSTPSGSFDRSVLIAETLGRADFVFLAGDLTRNSVTAVALAEGLKEVVEGAGQEVGGERGVGNEQQVRILVTRDAADLLAAESEMLLENGAIFVVSMAQLQKIFRAVYYPKVLMLSVPLVQVVETLHKFTLSFPATILTFHEGQILVAHDGKIVSTPLENTIYSPIALWGGELASKVLAMNLFTPGKPLEATSAAVMK